MGFELPHHLRDYDLYKKSQNQELFSEEDMIEFAHFFFREEFNSPMRDAKSSKETFEMWKLATNRN